MGKTYKISLRNSQTKYTFSWTAEKLECRKEQEISSSSVRPDRLWSSCSFMFTRGYGFFCWG